MPFIFTQVLQIANSDFSFTVTVDHLFRPLCVGLSISSTVSEGGGDRRPNRDGVGAYYKLVKCQQFNTLFVVIHP